MATLYKLGSSYYLNWREGGEQYRRSLGKIDRKEAEKILATKSAELAGLLTISRAVTVGDVLESYLDWAKEARPDSIRRIKCDLASVRSLDHHPAEGVDPSLIEAMQYRRGVATATQSKTIRMMRAAFRRAYKKRMIRHNPLELVDLPRILESREPHWYQHPDLAALGALRPLWTFAAFTGLRRGELAKARRSDIRGGAIHVESSATGRTKSGRWRVVPLSRQAVAALESLPADGLLAGGVHPDTLSDWFAADAKKLGLAGTLHSLRHTFCTMLAIKGASAHEIMKLAGHSSVGITERYMHHAPGAGASAIARLDKVGTARKVVRKSRSDSATRRPRQKAKAQKKAQRSDRQAISY